MLAASALTRLQALRADLAARAGQIVIDADTHATDLGRWPRPPIAHYFHGRALSLAELVAEMDSAAVDMALTWQNPAATIYPGASAENTEALLAANRHIAEASVHFPGRFFPAGWTDPRACGVDGALRIVETCVLEFGFPIVKMNPAQNRFPIDAPEVMEIVDAIVALGAVPAFHYGADTPFTPPSGLERIAVRIAPHPVLAVHMGGGGASYLEAEDQYQRSRELGLAYPNIKYILSAIRDTHIEQAFLSYQRAGHPFSANLFCGSDAPYGRMTWNFGGFRAMLQTLDGFTPAIAQNYLGGNFARFGIECIDRLIRAQGV